MTSRRKGLAPTAHLALEPEELSTNLTLVFLLDLFFGMVEVVVLLQVGLL